jgi:DNA-binding winged helix-turn-helix (wHTH) protein
MYDRGIAPVRNHIRFGPFHITVEERRIKKEGTTLDLGSRALDILLVLLEHPGAVIPKKDIITRVWRGLVVEDVALRVHICALRRSLGDGVANARYVVNVPGRGYCFVAPVYKSSATTSPFDDLPLDYKSTSQSNRGSDDLYQPADSF